MSNLVFASICPHPPIILPSVAINRFGYSVKRYDKQGLCPKCGEDLNIIE